jgi:hypothetical protein
MKSDRSWIRSVTIIERAFPMERTSAPQPSATAQPTATETARTRFIEDTAFNKPLAAPVNDPGLHAMALTAYRLGFRMSKVKNLLVLQVAGAVGYCFSRVRRRQPGTEGPDAERRPRSGGGLLRRQDNPKSTCSHGRTGNRFWISERRGQRACKDAGVAGLRFHDLRRSATRNITRKGVAATVAIGITGTWPALFSTHTT